MGRSRRSAAPATGSRTDPFRTARRRLTLLYVATIAVIVAVLSSALYAFHARDVEGIERGRMSTEAERQRAGTEGEPRRAATEAEGQRPAQGPTAGLEEYLEHLGRSIITADVITVLIGGVLSYLLAARTLQPIREAVQAEQRFFANAAHDLRTPLAVMRSEAEVALRGGSLDPAEARLLITSSLEEIRRMSAMVEQMLDLARSGSTPHRAGSLHPLDICALAVTTTTRIARRAEEREVRLLCDVPGPILIAGNASALERAVSNILENAVEYTPQRGSVTVAVRRDGGDAVLEVVDTGIGITPEELWHITEPFFRRDKARRVHAGGAGLGLTIAKTAMEEHRGSLHASSRPGGGTTISLRFPAR